MSNLNTSDVIKSNFFNFQRCWQAIVCILGFYYCVASVCVQMNLEDKKAIIVYQILLYFYCVCTITLEGEKLDKTEISFHFKPQFM